MTGVSRTPLSDATIGRIPCGVFLLAAAYDGHRSGTLTSWVQRCSYAPPLLMVAIRSGQTVEPMIRDARSFTLCQIGDEDRLLMRRFNREPERGEDPFDSLTTRVAPSGAPIVTRAMSYMDCQVVRHVDIETDHRLFVVQVTSAEMLQRCKPAVFTNGNGSPAWRNGHREVR